MSPAAGSSNGPVSEHRAQLRLTPAAHSVREARAFVARHLGLWALPDELADTTLLLVSEIVTNAVRHAPPPTWLHLRLVDENLQVAVTDVSPAAPLPSRAGPDDEGGRGLWLVEALADRWGHRPSGSGKVVWFELSR